MTYNDTLTTPRLQRPRRVTRVMYLCGVGVGKDLAYVRQETVVMVTLSSHGVLNIGKYDNYVILYIIYTAARSGCATYLHAVLVNVETFRSHRY